MSHQNTLKMRNAELRQYNKEQRSGTATGAANQAVGQHNVTGGLTGNIGRAGDFTTMGDIQDKMAAASSQRANNATHPVPVDMDPIYRGEISIVLNNNLNLLNDIEGALAVHFDRISPILGLNREGKGNCELNETSPRGISSFGDSLMFQNHLLTKLLNRVNEITNLVAL